MRTAPSDEECRRQSQAVAAADAADPELDAFIDAALADVAGEDMAGVPADGNDKRRAL